MKQTKEQEFNNLAVCGEFFSQTNSYGGIAIVVDVDGEAVLWRDCTSPREHTARRWQRIKWTVNQDPEKIRPYFTIYGRRYYIDDFMRCG